MPKLHWLKFRISLKIEAQFTICLIGETQKRTKVLKFWWISFELIHKLAIQTNSNYFKLFDTNSNYFKLIQIQTNS